MKLRFNILSPNNTGSPDFDICGQAAGVISATGLAVTCKLNGFDVFTCAPDVANIVIPATPFTIGTKTINSCTYSPLTGFEIEIQSVNTIGVEDILDISISKNDYVSYTNKFKLFDYDLGNSGLSGGTNPDFNFYLIDYTVINNLDSDGKQRKAFSKFISYRKPFTNEVYYYNAVGTQGTISYTNISDSTNHIPLFTGQNGIVCSDTGITISQSITVSNIYNDIYDICTSNLTIPYLQWLPIVNTFISCAPECNDTCVSNLATGRIETSIDTTGLSCINVNDVAIYPYHNSPYIDIVNTFYDYQGIEFSKTTNNITLDACGSACPQSPINFNLPTLPTLGDVVVKTEFIVKINNVDLINFHINCSSTNTISRCNWLTITESEVCGTFIITNCSIDATSLVIEQMQEDKSFLTISTIPISPLSNVEIVLQTDGVYTFSVPSKTVNGQFDTFIVINDCSLKACLYSKLAALMCNTHKDDCIANIKQYYDFNSFILNMHTYFALLNEEYNFNYIYNALDVTKIDSLYTIKQYLDNLATYCVEPCHTCNCSN